MPTSAIHVCSLHVALDHGAWRLADIIFGVRQNFQLRVPPVATIPWLVCLKPTSVSRSTWRSPIICNLVHKRYRHPLSLLAVLTEKSKSRPICETAVTRNAMRLNGLGNVESWGSNSIQFSRYPLTPANGHALFSRLLQL